ncbi:hypothetical protein REPUB_Repub02eG0096900 [Reevesia pubescens]
MHKLQVLIIQEPRISGVQADRRCKQFGLQEYFRVEAVGFSGGLWLIWNALEVDIEILAFSSQLIHAYVKQAGQVDWLLTAIYGSPAAEERKLLWESLKEASNCHDLPWMAIGDFNQVTSAEEKSSKRGVNLNQCRLMLECLNYCELFDLQASGPQLTWCNKRDGLNYTRVKLDRALANSKWCDLFNSISVMNLPRTYSDHHPVCVKVNCQTDLRNRSLSFRFERAWMLHDKFMEEINNSWGDNFSGMHDQLTALVVRLKLWSKKEFGDIYRRKKRLLARLNGIQKHLDKGPNDFLQYLEVRLVEDFNLVCAQEEVMLQQKARIDWIQLGDKNSKYFHNVIKGRKHKQMILALKNDEGLWTDDLQELKELVKNFYVALYTKESPLVEELPCLLSNWRLNQDDISSLRITLIQSVLSTIPGYLMQTTFLPDHVVGETTKIIRRFLWGEINGERKLHALNWDRVILPKEKGGLNIRDMRKTNLAYLAKLGWHIVNDSQSLWVDILRSKYMKNDDFFTVRVKNTASYTWRSILRGRDVLMQGLGSNVANGKRSKFWMDSWIQCGPLINFALREISELEADLSVADYCGNDGKINLEALHDVLPEDILLLIAAKWISPYEDDEDSIFWIHSPDGDFSVKSAYQMQIENLPEEGSWNFVWELKCPSKIKVFLWKVLHKAIPTKHFLVSRHIPMALSCGRCSTGCEDILHALRDCKISKATWRQLLPDDIRDSFFNKSLHDWVISNIRSASVLHGIPWAVVFAFAAWLIWYWRNCQIHDNQFVWPYNAVQIVTGRAKEAWDMLGNFSKRLNYEMLISWTKPPTDHVKMNVDGSVKGILGIATAGGVLRNESGIFICAFIYKIGISSILTAELWAILHGLQICWEKGYRRVLLESDSLEAIQKLNGQISAFDPNHHLIKTIKELHQRDWFCTFHHVYREANGCADWMATHDFHLDLGLHNFDIPPGDLFPLLMADAVGVAWPRYL